MLWVDEREGSRELAEPLRVLGLDVELQRLDYGDVCWMGDGPDGPCLVGVERKTVTDLLGSMRTGRLCGHQLPGMSTQYQTLYLVVEGVVRECPENGLLQQLWRGRWSDVRVGQQRFMWTDYEHYLTTLDTLAGVRVRRTGSLRESASVIKALYSWWQKPWSQHGSHKVIYTPDPRTVFLVAPATLRRVAVQLPGVGWERSREVERYFRTVRRMAEAEIADWRKIPGIGKAIAARVHRIINEGD